MPLEGSFICIFHMFYVPLRGTYVLIMDEIERKDAGGSLYYDVKGNPALLDKIRQCELRCFEYNQTPPGDVNHLADLLRDILGAAGDDLRIIQPFKCDYGYNISVGHHFFANSNLVILDAAPVTFGDHVFIGPNCGFYTVGHPLDYRQRNQGMEFAKPITVGSNVWIGGNVCVMPGVSIGDGCVIGGGSVVTSDVPAGTLAVGNPCRPVRDIS